MKKFNYLVISNRNLKICQTLTIQCGSPHNDFTLCVNNLLKYSGYKSIDKAIKHLQLIKRSPFRNTSQMSAQYYSTFRIIMVHCDVYTQEGKRLFEVIPLQKDGYEKDHVHANV